MNLDYHFFSEHIKPMSSIVSVEVFPDGSYGNIRLVTANSTFIQMTEQTYADVGAAAMHNVAFEPDQPYERYFPKDKNFEELCYRSAIKGETVHTYIHPDRMPVWLYLTAIPLVSDKPNVGYCAYLQSYTKVPDYALMTNIAPELASRVLQICMKLRSSMDFTASIKTVIQDIRDLCDAEHCCILNTDFKQRRCAVLCEALSEDTKLSSMEKYVDDSFFAVVDTWHDTIAGSTCVIIKDAQDWADLERTNPVWYHSMKPAGAKSIVLFPLRYHEETLGYIWAINFDVSKTAMIKEMLELTTYFLASELASYQLFRQMELLSSKDVLTGILNRNAMNNRIDYFLSGKSDPEQPLCIIFADLNGLKQINDRSGHFTGDLLLKDAALTLQKHFPDFEIYRAGGDEFMVLALHQDKAVLEQKIQGFKAAAADPDGVCFAVGWSYGTTGKIRKALQEADSNMYADKEAFYQKYPDKRR
ncbi:MAG: sensor domain-containing diguanylate cyclase [Oscillospiraceae bacterium]|nr:sensor domain-containing diguanylate cyclase [Oscillospiraceae bacterium]